MSARVCPFRLGYWLIDFVFSTNALAEGQPPIIGTLYVQKWFAGNATEIEVTVRKP